MNNAGLDVSVSRQILSAACRESVIVLRMISASRGREKVGPLLYEVHVGRESFRTTIVFSMTGLHETMPIPPTCFRGSLFLVQVEDF